RHGSSEVTATAFTIPSGSAGYWLERLKGFHVFAERAPRRFGEEVVRFADPDGTMMELIESVPSDAVFPWSESPVPAEYAVRGFHSVSLSLQSSQKTAELITDIFGYQLVQESENRSRFIAAGGAGPGRAIDLISVPDLHSGQIAAGSVHHIAFRVPDDEQQLAWREKLNSLGYKVSLVMDRTYFHSIYFREPGGVLFELATDLPGFTKDEPADELGANLRLPEWLEKTRPQIEKMLPEITVLKRAAR
ncbi:MAG: ring-cleaving dioxygenase, partial [Verrucomicrobia bacterium]|nr:ring-cleaving dioxygenase [Verrucomicrobiota bacterium]